MDEAARKRYNPRFAPVAQLDRVLVSEAKGHRFESCRARHSDTSFWVPRECIPRCPLRDGGSQLKAPAADNRRFATYADLGERVARR